MQAHGATIVDHGLCVPSAELVFVHNLATEAARHVPSEIAAAAPTASDEFFRALHPAAIVVANSKLVAGALREHFALARERVAVLYPGIAARPLLAAARRRSCARARAPLLGIDAQPRSWDS